MEHEEKIVLEEEEETSSETLMDEINKLKQRIQELEAKKNKRKESEPVECEHCHHMFKNKYILKTHIKNIHGENRQRFECEHCHKTFASKYYLAKHINDKHTINITNSESSDDNSD